MAKLFLIMKDKEKDFRRSEQMGYASNFFWTICNTFKKNYVKHLTIQTGATFHA